jgi:hypothetical protein
MTRQELIDGLIAWQPPETIKRRDELQFALWWYGASTEAEKPDPSWPDTDYVACKSGGGPRYLFSIADALALVPRGFNWFLASGKLSEAEHLYGFQIVRGSTDLIAEAESEFAAVAICIAAIKARLVQRAT